MSSVDLMGRAGLDSRGSIGQSDACEEFFVQGTRWCFGAVALSELTLSSFQHDPSAGADVVFPLPGSVHVVFVLEGVLKVKTDESTLFFIANSAALLPRGPLPAFSSDKYTRVLMVTIAGDHVRKLEGLLPHQIAGISSAVVRTHPALPFFRGLIHTAGTHAIRAEPAAAIISRLMAELLTADEEWHTRAPRPELSEILALISEHHTDRKFGPRALARRSRRTHQALERLLREQAEHKTAEELITERRLVSAMTLLHPENALTVDQIAHRCGFATREALDSVIESIYGFNASTLLSAQQPVPRETPGA